MWFGIWPLLCFVGFVSVCRCSLLPVGCCGGWLPLVVFGRCSLLPVGCCGGWLPLVVSGCCGRCRGGGWLPLLELAFSV